MNDWQSRVNEAFGCLRRGDTDGASRCLQGADGPHAPPAARFAMAQVHFQRDDLPRGIEILEGLQAASALNDSGLHQLAMAHNNLGSRLVKSGDPDVAERHLRRALELNPQQTEARENLARLQQRAGDHAACLAILEPLLASNPNDSVLSLRTRALLDAGEIESAGAQAAEISDEGHRLTLQAELALQSGDGPTARDRLRRAAARDPKRAVAAATTLQPVYRDDAERQAERRAYANGLDWLERLTSENRLPPRDGLDDWPAPGSFFLAYQGLDDLELQQRSGRLLRSWLGAEAEQPVPDDAVPGRVVVVSSFLRDCTVGHYFRAWMEALREAGFDVYLMQLERAPDWLTADMAGGDESRILSRRPSVADRVRELRELRPAAVLFPEIGMHDPTRKIAAHRLAPFQAAAWGHPVTTGLDSIDAFISSDAMEPNSASAHYSETLHRLPGLGTGYRPAQAGDEGRAEFGLGGGRLVLVPHNSFKIAPEMDETFCGILKADPDCELILIEGSAPWQTRLLRQRLSERLGGRAERVRWLPAMPRARFLALCRCADLCLDSRPYSGGNVSLDCLAVGTPVVTLPGNFMRGRQTAGMLTMMGLADCIAEGVDELSHLALDAAHDTSLRDRVLDGGELLFDQTGWRESLVALLGNAR